MPSRRKQVTLQQKKALRDRDRLLSYSASANQLIAWFKAQYGIELTKADVSKFRSKRYAYLDHETMENLNNRRRKRQQKWPMLEDALAAWVAHKQGKIIITAAVLREQAMWFWKQLYGARPYPAFSNGWLYGFQQRFHIQRRTIYGEAADVPDNAQSNIEPIQQLLKKMDPRDIYNCDETGLFWRMVPDKSLSTKAVRGRKKDKSRVTAHFCCNADGSHLLPIWWIGSAKTPHAFRSVHIENITHWRYNRKAWMTTQIMCEWLRWFDGNMHGRKVVLIMDNFSAHIVALNKLKEEGFILANTEVIFLPPNTTSVFQPLDQGIIRTWKTLWRRHWIKFMLKEDEQNRDFLKSMTVLQAIRWGNYVWDCEISIDTIKNCFNKGLQLLPLETIKQNDEHQQRIEDDVRHIYQECQRISSIQELMNINNFLNPKEEEVNDPDDDFNQYVVDQLLDASTDDATDIEHDAEDTMTKRTYKDAMEAIQVLIQFEEQRKKGNEKNLRWLNQHMASIRIEEEENKVQRPITSFFVPYNSA